MELKGQIHSLQTQLAAAKASPVRDYIAHVDVKQKCLRAMVTQMHM